jgi:hypothetical protein
VTADEGACSHVESRGALEAQGTGHARRRVRRGQAGQAGHIPATGPDELLEVRDREGAARPAHIEDRAVIV